MTVDSRRLARALIQFTAEPLGAGRYRVTGPTSLHVVELSFRNGAACECEDTQHRGAICKHELAARLVAGDGDVVAAARRLFLAATNRQVRLLSFVKELRHQWSSHLLPQLPTRL